jgi:hypothetical protein
MGWGIRMQLEHFLKIDMAWGGSILHPNIFIWAGSSAGPNKLPPEVSSDFLPYNVVFVQLLF